MTARRISDINLVPLKLMTLIIWYYFLKTCLENSKHVFQSYLYTRISKTNHYNVFIKKTANKQPSTTNLHKALKSVVKTSIYYLTSAVACCNL